jgi:hypothetical protein
LMSQPPNGSSYRHYRKHGALLVVAWLKSRAAQRILF